MQDTQGLACASGHAHTAENDLLEATVTSSWRMIKPATSAASFLDGGTFAVAEMKRHRFQAGETLSPHSLMQRSPNSSGKPAAQQPSAVAHSCSVHFLPGWHRHSRRLDWPHRQQQAWCVCLQTCSGRSGMIGTAQCEENEYAESMVAGLHHMVGLPSHDWAVSDGLQNLR